MQLSRICCVVIVFLLISLCACGCEGMSVISFSPENENFVSLAKHTYSYDELLEISQFPGNISAINQLYPIECARRIGDSVRVAYKGDGYIAIIIYDCGGTKRLGRVYSCVMMKSAFDSLAIGSTLDDVRRVDINGDYTFMYTGRKDSPSLSTHYTKDGYLITISYDAHNTVSSITVSLI